MILNAEVLSEVYHRLIEARVVNRDRPLPETVQQWRMEAQGAVMIKWKARLENPRAGVRTIEALQPMLEKWVRRRHGVLSYRLVQVLTGHGCFGEFLHKVARREPNPICHHCGCSEDTAQHTLELCQAWAVWRRDLTEVIGRDLSLPSVIKAITNSERNWAAVATYCECVMSQKEAAERIRESNALADPIRRQRMGRRRRAYAASLQMPP